MGNESKTHSGHAVLFLALLFFGQEITGNHRKKNV